MTMGLTGVIWLPRGATVNSTSLAAGAGPVPLGVAAAAWTALSASLADAHLTLVRITAELAASWHGVSAAAALARITPFTVWTAECAELAADTALEAGLEASAYTAATLVMPGLPEIVAVKTAKTTAYSTGGALNGSAAAAEAADRALDVRAALVMEGYEAASSILALERAFTMPPRIVTRSDSEATDGFDDLDHGSEFDPIRTAAAALTAAVQNPTVATAASQFGSVAGTAVSTATSAATDIGGAALSALTSRDTAPMGGHTSVPSSGSPRAEAASTSAAAARSPLGTAVGRIGGVLVPEGWGASEGPAQGARSSTPATAPGGSSSDPRAAASPAAGGRSTGILAGPVTSGRVTGAVDAHAQEVRENPDYLQGFEHFSDGRTVIPPVIGGTDDEREPGQ